VASLQGDEFLIDRLKFGVLRGLGESALEAGGAVFGSERNFEGHFARGAADFHFADRKNLAVFEPWDLKQAAMSSSVTAHGRVP
jgi:hypothetical protein